LENIKIVEEIYILLNLLSILGSILLFFMPIMKLPDMYVKKMGYITFLYFLFILFIDGFLIYNVYKFGTNLPFDCRCAKGWQKYYLYLQAGSMLFLFILMIFALMYMLSDKKLYKGLKKFKLK